MRPITKALRPKFTPARLFAAGAQGAWYDPSSLWGASDHLPRRNLAGYSEDISTSTWSRAGLTTATTDTLTENALSSAHCVYQSWANLTPGSTYRISAEIAAGTATKAQLFLGASVSLVGYVNVDLTAVTATAAAIGTGWSASNASIVDVGSGWYAVSVDVTIQPTATTIYLQLNITNDSWAFTYTGTSRTLKFRKVFLRSTSVIDQSYQKITDWTTEQYAWAAAKNVPWLRRNRFLNTATLSTQTVSSVTATPLTVSFTGTGTITFSTAYVGTLVGTGVSDRVTKTFTPAAGNLVCTVSGSVTLAQCEVAGSATAYQEVGASWEAQYAANAAAAGVALTLYQDSAGTTPVTGPDSVIGKLNDLSGLGYHAIQSGATGLKPTLRLSPNGYWYIQRDLSDDALVTTFPNLGTACASYINDGSTVTETTGLTLNGALTQSTPAADYGRIYLDAPTSKLAQLTKWLKAKAGLA